MGGKFFWYYGVVVFLCGVLSARAKNVSRDIISLQLLSNGKCNIDGDLIVCGLNSLSDSAPKFLVQRVSGGSYQWTLFLVVGVFVCFVYGKCKEGVLALQEMARVMDRAKVIVDDSIVRCTQVADAVVSGSKSLNTVSNTLAEALAFARQAMEAKFEYNIITGKGQIHILGSSV